MLGRLILAGSCVLVPPLLLPPCRARLGAAGALDHSSVFTRSIRERSPSALLDDRTRTAATAEHPRLRSISREVARRARALTQRPGRVARDSLPPRDPQQPADRHARVSTHPCLVCVEHCMGTASAKHQMSRRFPQNARALPCEQGAARRSSRVAKAQQKGREGARAVRGTCECR